MFKHNLKIAFRNMRKYFNQTLISVIGLAVGFTCFALATLWIRYEMTFDSFHKNADRMYVVYQPDTRNQTGYDYNRGTPHPLAAHLRETFPEIKSAVTLHSSNTNRISFDEIEIQGSVIEADTAFIRMFDVKIIEGAREFLFPGSQNIAITQDKARQLFGKENPIGKKIEFWSDEYIISSIVAGLPKQSNFPFDFIMYFNRLSSNHINDWRVPTQNTIIELFPETNVEAFEKKLFEHEIVRGNTKIEKMTIKPITKMRYTDPNVEKNVKFQHLLIFALSGLLVILCSLFNYLTLFVSRFRIRQKELALRVVCGASAGSLLLMLSIEFIITLLLALLTGCIFTQWLHRPFLALSDIQMNLSAIHIESLIYLASVIVVSLLMFWLILFIFRQRTLNLSIRRSNKKMFRKVSVVVQLIISIGFAFCTTVILKQMHFLHQTEELGFSFKNRGSISALDMPGASGEALANYLKQIPEITEIVDIYGESLNLVPQTVPRDWIVNTWDDNPAQGDGIVLKRMSVTPEYLSFYDFRLLAGEMLTEGDSESMALLNESAAKAFGWQDPIGKRFDDKYIVKGVIRNVYNFAPTIPPRPYVYTKHNPDDFRRPGNQEGVAYTVHFRTLLFKFHEDTWKSCVEKIEQFNEERFEYSSDISLIMNVLNTEEEFNKFLKSERALIRLLSFVSAICILICVFGFVSLVSLTCEERRKEIAIRKVNGATADDIIAIFAKEYSLLLLIGAAIAFSTGHLIMQRWLEHYAIRTNIPAWLYLSIIFVLALVIVVCVGWQVYKSSVENPAEVVKSE